MKLITSNFSINILPPLLSLLVSFVIIYIILFKSRFKSENVIFIILCVWWSLLSPVFICHQLFRGNEDLILKIERIVHFFYVYTPAISLLYFSRAIDIGNIRLVKISFVISFIISLFTPTSYYIPALNKYSWGYMGQGGAAFLAFGVYAASVLVYLIIFFIRKIRVETNQMKRLKLKYIIASFLISGILSIMNYPAIVGIDLYPPGNFSFIPLSFLAYGVLRHRLLDFRGIFQIATIWGLLSAILTVPNIIVLYLLYPYIERDNFAVLLISGILWFFVNYHFFRIVHQHIDKFFNKRKLELMKIESDFIESIYSLKTLDELVKQFTDVIKKGISFETAELILCETGGGNPPGFDTRQFHLSPDIKNMLIRSKVLIDRDSIEYNQSCGKEGEELLEIFRNYNSKYIIPLTQHNNLIALLMLPETKERKPLTPDEILFIKNVKSSAAISLANSIMYSDLNRLKDNLNSMVEEKTAELEKSMEALQGVVDSLEKEVQDKVVSYFARKKLEDTIKYIEENYHEEISRESLAKMTNMNSDYLGRMFKKLTDRNIADYINDIRLKKACELLLNTDDSIVDIAFAVGFESLPTFYRVFKKTIDDTPVNYRTKYKIVNN
ncbi:MAG: hypothetical protein CVV49_00345 [Spirochaetae bacterium HGW-Spirochaetae-5]|nr:MAG: hypothetical protein CVV49_00345 [Spirochaetae bacterium HGW-Spirochaetae-5]